MSMNEILNELPKLKPDERNLLFLTLHDLEAQTEEKSVEAAAVSGDFEASDDSSTEEIREHVRKVALAE